MRSWRSSSAILLALISSGEMAAQANASGIKHYNVLFIASDDLNNDIHCFGDPQVKTPNLDRLAARGICFERAYNQFPLSGPSRASLLSGYRPDRTKVMDLKYSVRDRMPEVVTLPQLYRESGYFTFRTGKIFHYGVPNEIGTDGQDDTISWKQRVNPKGRDRIEQDRVTNLTPKRHLGTALAYWATDGPDAELTDAMIAEEAAKTIREHKNEPFFIAAGFFRPHTPYIAPQKYFDMYPPEELVLPEERVDDWENKPSVARFTDPLHWGLSEKERRIALQAYYASITFMDAQLGKLLDALDESGLSNNTIIVFWSDHGYNVGQHGQWMKQSLFEHAARTPLIISVPGMAQDKTCKRTVELLDIYPTLTEICGLQGPADLQGKSLLPLLKNPEAKWDRPAYTQVLRRVDKKEIFGRTVRTERFRYTEWDEGREGVEMYDYETDPNEFNNLAKNPAFASKMRELSGLLDAVDHF